MSEGFRFIDNTCWIDDDGNSIEIVFDHRRVLEKKFIASKLSAFEQVKGRIEKRIRRGAEDLGKLANLKIVGL